MIRTFAAATTAVMLSFGAAQAGQLSTMPVPETAAFPQESPSYQGGAAPQAPQGGFWSALAGSPAYGAGDFSGFYVGVNLGGRVGGRDDVHTNGQAAPNIANIAGGARPGFVPLDRKGVLGGVQAGYNYQYGPYVVGLETDFDGIDADDTNTVVTKQLNTGLPLNNTFRSQQTYLGTVRGRFGMVFHRALIYGTGGLAYGDTRQRVTMFGPTGGVVQFQGDHSEVRTGYAAGGGIEYPLRRNVTVKAEYLYYDLGKEAVDVAVVPGSGGAGTGYNSFFHNDGHVFRIGLNYAFR